MSKCAKAWKIHLICYLLYIKGWSYISPKVPKYIKGIWNCKIKYPQNKSLLRSNDFLYKKNGSQREGGTQLYIHIY